MPRRLNAHAFVGLALVLTGIGLFLNAQRIDVSPAVVLLGPRLFPSIVAVGLVLLGLLTLASALAGSREARADPADRTVENDWPAFLMALAGPVLFLLTVETLGFAAAAALLFACVARAFGSRRPLVDLALGLVIGALILIVFSYGLGLALPAGALLDAWTGG
ncbi:MAG: tripartite tricarboxylate transporter TctB family protein [Hyphomicrobiaceae bacterium]|nr:tripartite tricarboxylate transporter TctB family protein [Hyphomicrobiaceae bacterium]